MLAVVGRESDDAQTDFVDRLSKIAGTVRVLLESNGFLRQFKYQPTQYWPSLRGKVFAFIDGGVANIDLPSAAPIGIRVGSYIVRPGDTTEARESFNIELSLVDDLYSSAGVLYDDHFLDVAKLRDAARIVSEASTGLAISNGPERRDAVIVHGPLVNPVSPYGVDKFPSFGHEAARKLLGEPSWDGTERARQFVALYLELLERTRASGAPVVGVVERSIGRDPVFIRRVLQRLHADGVLKEKDSRDLEHDIRSYGLNDATLLDVVLAEGEYVVPVAVDRQGPRNKWPEFWHSEIERFPRALTTYLKPAMLVMPFRIEAFENIDRYDDLLNLIFHTSRLLPSYGFPVGLDIVDRFAKVPAWLSRGVRGQHQVVLLRKALESADPRAVAFAKRVLAAKGRDWLFRPET